MLFDSADEIEIFNKKAIYLYLRELTGMNTKQIVSQLNKMKKILIANRGRNRCHMSLFILSSDGLP